MNLSRPIPFSSPLRISPSPLWPLSSRPPPQSPLSPLSPATHFTQESIFSRRSRISSIGVARVCGRSGALLCAAPIFSADQQGKAHSSKACSCHWATCEPLSAPFGSAGACQFSRAGIVSSIGVARVCGRSMLCVAMRRTHFQCRPARKRSL